MDWLAVVALIQREPHPSLTHLVAEDLVRQ